LGATIQEATKFCSENDIPIPNMNEAVPKFGRSRKGGKNITLDHYFRVDTFYATINAITTEFIIGFNEVSSKLLVCFSCLDPRDSFSKFDVENLARLTEIYSDDFSYFEKKGIKDQLELFIIHVRRIEEFRDCHDLASLAAKMVELDRHTVFPSVYRLIELALILPVATASVERVFSAMKIIKTELRNKMSDDWLNYLMVCYIEREIFKGIDLEKIKNTFQNKKDRQMQLPRPPRHD